MSDDQVFRCGHPRTDENSYFVTRRKPKPRRMIERLCKICQKARCKKQREKKREEGN